MVLYGLGLNRLSMGLYGLVFLRVIVVNGWAWLFSNGLGFGSCFLALGFI
jgi:hypothetical protein